jgi:hypothetical protein
VREKWLYAWFREQFPTQAERAMESILIVHDELEGAWLFVLWVMGGGSTKVRSSAFEGPKAREAFRNVNDQNGQPLRLVASKSAGYPADFYFPAT